MSNMLFTSSPFNNDPKNVFTITFESLVFGICAIILGAIIDKEFRNLSKIYPEHKILLSLLQITLSGFIIAIIYVYISPFFTNHFQRTLSGLAFPAVFYSVQSNIYTPWQ